MNNRILDFLEAYKNLDELCKQILSSDVGVSQYIEDMEKETQGLYYVTDWEKDYKKLKHMRFIRNQLVHDPNSFNNNLVTLEDIEWIKVFRLRIIKCTDPFSILNQSHNQEGGVKAINDSLPKVEKQDNLTNSKKSKRKVLVAVFLLEILLTLYLLYQYFNYIENYTYGEMRTNSIEDEIDFETLVFSGENSATIKNINIPNGNYYIIGKFYGDGIFSAELHKSVKDDFGHLIANKIGECESIYGLQGPIENGYINVEMAFGKWEFTIIACERMSEENLTEQYTYTGSGAKVIPNINLPKGEYYITCTYKGDRNFCVTFYDSINNNYGDLIANTIGQAEVTYGIQGPVKHGYIDIDMANGDWVITIDPCNN